MISLQTLRNTRSSSVVTLAATNSLFLKKLPVVPFATHHLTSGINFLTHFVNHVLICLFLVHLFSTIISPPECHHHHSYQNFMKLKAQRFMGYRADLLCPISQWWKIRKSGPATLTFVLDSVLSIVKVVHFHAKFHQAMCSGSWVIVSTEKKRKHKNFATMLKKTLSSLPRTVKSRLLNCKVFLSDYKLICAACH